MQEQWYQINKMSHHLIKCPSRFEGLSGLLPLLIHMFLQAYNLCSAFMILQLFILVLLLLMTCSKACYQWFPYLTVGSNFRNWNYLTMSWRNNDAGGFCQMGLWWPNTNPREAPRRFNCDSKIKCSAAFKIYYFWLWSDIFFDEVGLPALSLQGSVLVDVSKPVHNWLF